MAEWLSRSGAARLLSVEPQKLAASTLEKLAERAKRKARERGSSAIQEGRVVVE